MITKTDFTLENSAQIQAALCRRLREIRLTRNITQAELAQQAGVDVRSIRNLEAGKGMSLDTFLRVLGALNLQTGLQDLLPDPTVRPMERARPQKKERQRARPRRHEKIPTPWKWGDEQEKPA